MKQPRICLVWVIGAVLACAVLAAGTGLTPGDVAGLRVVGSVEISPDGRFVAFTLSIPRSVGEDEDGPAWQELHVVGLNPRTEPRAFVSGQVNVSGVDWSPDGRWISFLSKRDEDKHTALYTIPVNGGESRVAVRMKSSILGYSWAPDSRRVAVIATPPEPEQVAEQKKHGLTQQVYEEDWSPRQLYVTEVFSDDADVSALPLDGSVFDAVWSPGDDRIAVAVAPTPLVDDSYMSRKIHVVDAVSGKITASVSNSGKLGEIAWSPDGKHLAIVSGVDINDPIDGSLFVASTVGGEMTRLMAGFEGHVRDVAWQSLDTILFLADEGVWTHFGEIKRDGSQQKWIYAGESKPVLTSFSLSSNGLAAAFVGSSPQHPDEVFALTHGQEGPERLTDSNPWLAERELAPHEVVRFKVRDGLQLEGILIRPLGREPGKKVPLVLYVHGGPESHHRNGWLTSYSSPGQMAAARGMAVFHTNYRGSTGRGVDFSKLSQGDPAGKEFDDLVDAVDHLIDSGLVDADRVGITGGSYGGYATAWGSTYYSDRFAAGVMFVGISNKISKVGTTDIPDEEFLVHARKRPWDNWQLFLERSPVYYADRSRTPLLILHGTADPRVNVGQSRELYRHLKLRGKAPVRLVLYPGEQHGNRRAASRLDYNLRALRWLEHYLKGPGGAPPPFQMDYDSALGPQRARSSHRGH